MRALESSYLCSCDCTVTEAKMQKSFWIVAVLLPFAAAAMMLTTFPVYADSVVPGQTVAPDVFTLSSTPTGLDEVTGSFSMSAGGGTITGTYTDVVLYDPFGVTCPTCLDFALKVSVNSGSPGELLDVFYGAWLNYSTDVGYVPGSGGGDDPTSVTRGTAGEDMGFLLASPLTAGNSTDFFVIATNATAYSAINNTSGDSPLALTGSNAGSGATDVTIPGAYLVPTGPPVATPEPSSLLLTLVGLLGLMGMASLGKRLA
jgi:hypothetical protein